MSYWRRQWFEQTPRVHCRQDQVVSFTRIHHIPQFTVSEDVDVIARHAGQDQVVTAQRADQVITTDHRGGGHHTSQRE